MAIIKLDDTTAGRTYVAKITRDSDGQMWNGVDDFVAENTLTDAQQATAVGLATTTAVVSGTGTHSHYIFTTPVGITVACHVGLYLTSYAVGTEEAFGADYDPTDAAIKAKTDLIPASPAAVGSAMTLTAAYDAAKTAAPTVAQIRTEVLTKGAANDQAAAEEDSLITLLLADLSHRRRYPTRHQDGHERFRR